MTAATSSRTKYCPDCKTNRPLTDFHVNAGKSQGVGSYCRTHAKARAKARQANKPPKPATPRRPPAAQLRSYNGTALTKLVEDGAWGSRAICGGKWDLLENGPDHEARALCRGCPVWRECREWALGLSFGEDPGGMRGGLTFDERKAERRRRDAQRATPAGEKSCTRCGETKPLGQFHRHRRNADGRSTICAACCNKRNRRWRAQTTGREVAELRNTTSRKEEAA